MNKLRPEVLGERPNQLGRPCQKRTWTTTQHLANIRGFLQIQSN